MHGTVETHIGYVPFSEIDLDNRWTFFRTPDEEDDLRLKESLSNSGQKQPLILEQNELGRFVILDGHKRCRAVNHIREEGSTWDKVLAHVIAPTTLSPLDRFVLLKNKNFAGDNAYALEERGRFFRAALRSGVTVQQMAKECRLSVHAIEDYFELADLKPELAAILRDHTLDPVYAVMLHRRYEACLLSPHAAKAGGIAERILNSVVDEEISMKTWKFLLDFYWGQHRPFMSE